jgi:hypothetical protein
VPAPPALITAIVGGLTSIGLITLIPQKIMGLWFDRNLEAFKTEQNDKLGRLQEQLNHLTDRGRLSNAREYDATAIAWEAYVEARWARKLGDACCGFDVKGTEGLWPALPIEAHGIQDALDTRDGSGNGAIIIDVGMDRLELNVGEKRWNASWMPRCNPHRKIALKQTLDDALAEKASPAENGHLPSCHCSVHRDDTPKFRLWTPAPLDLHHSHRPDHDAVAASSRTPVHQIFGDHRSDLICKTISTPPLHRACTSGNRARIGDLVMGRVCALRLAAGGCRSRSLTAG